MNASIRQHAIEVPSPCIQVCRMDPRTSLCEGCYRTIDEIAGWSALSGEEKRAVWNELARRRGEGPD